MKKTLVFLILFTFSMNYSFSNVAATFPDYCDDPYFDDLSLDYSLCFDYTPPEDYSSIADNSEYDRIEKIDGIWYGVIEVTDLYVDTAFIGVGRYMNVIGISFSRDLLQLAQIEYDYTTLETCTGWLTVLGCIGDMKDSYSDTKILNDKYNTNDFIDFLNGDNIIEGNDDYDYYLYVQDDPYEFITVIKFSYILTSQEVIDLRLDIQEQYEIEKNIVLNNPLLTADERLVLIVALIEEYKDYQIDFDELMTSICIGDECTAYNTGGVAGSESLDWLEEWTENFEEKIADFLLTAGLVIIGVLTSGVIVYMITYAIAKSIMKGTGNIAKGGFKFTKTSGNYWGKALANGIAAFFSNIGTGIKNIFSRK